LTVAREHPAAATRRQQEADVAILLPTMAGLTERQQQLFFLFQSVIAKSQPVGLARLVDADVAEACAAAAATIETAAKGVLYEHRPTSIPAQQLATEFGTMLVQIREHGAAVYDREAAIVLRAIEKGARTLTGASDTAYLTLLGRLLQVSAAQNAAQEAVGDTAKPPEPRAKARPGSIIIP
jgi:hypothetical protein